MPIKLGVVMDPIEQINPKKDSTLAMLLESQQRNWAIHYMTQNDLFIHNSQAYGNMHTLTVHDDLERWYEFGINATKKLTDLDVILMRKDPPFTTEYIYTTYILELAEQHGTLIVNKPQSLRDANEKLFTSFFPQCCTEFIVSRDKQQLVAFLENHGKVIFKPLDTMGGRSVFLLQKGDPNTAVVIETLSNFGQQYMMAQRFIPDIKDGDKRILLINGEPIPYGLARVPALGGIRGNLAAGGKGAGIELSKHDYWICEQLKPVLQSKGLLFVGIDVIGDYLTEINVTSPTCIREIDAIYNINISAHLMDCISSLLKRC